jgi:hypothetical protein
MRKEFLPNNAAQQQPEKPAALPDNSERMNILEAKRNKVEQEDQETYQRLEELQQQYEQLDIQIATLRHQMPEQQPNETNPSNEYIQALTERAELARQIENLSELRSRLALLKRAVEKVKNKDQTNEKETRPKMTRSEKIRPASEAIAREIAARAARDVRQAAEEELQAEQQKLRQE